MKYYLIILILYPVFLLAQDKPEIQLQSGQYNGWVEVSPDANFALLSDFGAMILCDLNNGKELRKIPEFSGKLIFFTTDSKNVIYITDSGIVKKWNLYSNQTTEIFKLPPFSEFISISLDLKKIAVKISIYNKIKILDIENNKEILDFKCCDINYQYIKFSPYFNYFLISYKNGIKSNVFDAKTGKLYKELNGELGLMHSVKFSPDETMFLSGNSKELVLWSINKKNPIMTLKGFYMYYQFY